MATRHAFHLSLENVRKMVLEMGMASRSALRQAIDSLLSLDTEMATSVVQGDQTINQLQFTIEEDCIRLLARQQPVANDLRRIMAALHISIDLERIADMAVDVAKTTLRLQQMVPDLFRQDINAMIDMVDAMITLALDAYALESSEKAELLADRDDQMDQLYRQTLERLAAPSIGNETENIYSYAILARCMERIGDHATNIGESVLYIETGNRADLN
jgi:phosphate transport system protein